MKSFLRVSSNLDEATHREGCRRPVLTDGVATFAEELGQDRSSRGGECRRSRASRDQAMNHASYGHAARVRNRRSTSTATGDPIVNWSIPLHGTATEMLCRDT
jgi:hypothetical protein